MKLFLISQSFNNGYDTFDSAVVCAESEEKARNIHPGGDEDWEGFSWAPRNLVEVMEIGLAHPSCPSGVICASFNAG